MWCFFLGAQAAADAGPGAQGADSFYLSPQHVKIPAMCTHLLFMGTGEVPQLLPHFTELYNKLLSRQLRSELCSPSQSSRDRHIFHWATWELKAVFKGIVGFWSNAFSLNNNMKTLTFDQKALKEPINVHMEMLLWYLAKVSVSRQAHQQVISPATPGSSTASLALSFQHNHICEIYKMFISNLLSGKKGSYTMLTCLCLLWFAFFTSSCDMFFKKASRPNWKSTQLLNRKV